MINERNNKPLKIEKFNEQLPFHYPLLLTNKNALSSLHNRINKETFYNIYNDFQKKYRNNKKSKKSIPTTCKKNNISFNNQISSNKNYKFLPRKKNNVNKEISKSLSMNKTNSIDEVSFNDDKNNINNRTSKNKEFRKNRKELIRCSSNYNPYLRNLNLNNEIDKINLSYMLSNKQYKNINKNNKENKSKSFIFKRNQNNKIFSSKSFFSYNNRNILGLKSEIKSDENKLNNNNNFIQNYNNKKTSYNKRMANIDKIVKKLNIENQKLNYLSFNKKNIIKNILNDDNKNRIKFENVSGKESKNNRTILDINQKIHKNKENFYNKILFNKFITQKEPNMRIKRENIDKNDKKTKMYESKNFRKDNLSINLKEKEKRKNIHKMIEYVLKNQRFKEKESEKNGNNIKLLNIQKINSLKELEENKKVNISDENHKKAKNKNKINKIPIAPKNLKYYKNIHESHININNNFVIKEFKNESNKNNSKENIDYIKNDNNDENISFKFTMNESLNNDDLNYENLSNKENEKNNNSFKSTFSNNSNSPNKNSKISEIRKYLNNYYENKYNKKLSKNNSFNCIGDNSPNKKERNYYDLLKNNLLQNLIKEDNKNNNINNYFNNLSSNVNINININPKNISDKNIDINLINSNRNNKESKTENNDENSLQLLTPSFMRTQNEANQEKNLKEKIDNNQNTYKNLDLKEEKNIDNIFSFIPYRSNNNKFSSNYRNDYTFKNMNSNYRKKLIKKNNFKLNQSDIDNHKNFIMNENQIKKQNLYNINQEKRKEDLFQLLHFSQNLAVN